MTSRAANELRIPTPICQSKPSGAITGSIRCPTRPANECSRPLRAVFCAACCRNSTASSVCPANSIRSAAASWTRAASGTGLFGYVAKIHKTIEIARMTVPARLTKIRALSKVASSAERRLGTL